MASASIELSGPDAERWASDLHAALVLTEGSAAGVSPVEVQRSADLVVAVIGLAFSGVGTAKTIWDWWQPHRSTGVKIKILLEDGAKVDLSEVDQQQLEIEFDRRAEPDK